MRSIRILSYFFAALAAYAAFNLLFRGVSFLVQDIEPIARIYAVSTETMVQTLAIASIFEIVGGVSAYFCAKYLRRRRGSIYRLMRVIAVCGLTYVLYGLYQMSLAVGDFSKFRVIVTINGALYILFGVMGFLFGLRVVLLQRKLYHTLLENSVAERILLDKPCKDCDENVPPLSESEIKKYASLLVSKWDVVRNKRIRQVYRFKSFTDAMTFLEQVALLAEAEGHHPDMTISYDKVIVELTTHSIGGLSESDFIMAHKIELLQS